MTFENVNLLSYAIVIFTVKPHSTYLGRITKISTCSYSFTSKTDTEKGANMSWRLNKWDVYELVIQNKSRRTELEKINKCRK